MVASGDDGMNARVSFSGQRDGYAEIRFTKTTRTSWYSRFTANKADAFLIEYELQYLTEHAIYDFLIACRNSLTIGGRIRIGEPDLNNPSRIYLDNIKKYNTLVNFKIRDLARIMAKVDFAVLPLEFCDENGNLHILNDSDYYKFGYISRSFRNDIRARDPQFNFSSIVVDGIKISDERLDTVYGDPIYVIGDSHVRFLAGKDELSGGVEDIGRVYRGFSAKFIAYHLGPGLTYNLDKYGSKTGTIEKIEALIDQGRVPNNARLLFSFGEIDCRFHVCRRSEQSGKTVDEIVRGLCEIYIKLLDKVKNKGFRPMVWAPFATTWKQHWPDPEFPVYGSYEKRYQAVLIFNETMRRLCEDRGYDFMSLFWAVNDRENNPIQGYFCDAVHLSQAARHHIHDMMPYGDLLEKSVSPGR